jgi:mono/diheme cytochrome c family protein
MTIGRTLLLCAALAAVPALMGAGDPAKGKAAFQQQCAVCHSTSDVKKMGPALKGLFSREKLANGKKPTEANVRAKLEEGGGGMPSYKTMLAPAIKDDVIAFLKTL